MRLRKAIVSDVDDLLEIQQEGAVRALSHIFAQDNYPFPYDDIHARWIAEIGDPQIEAYVIEMDDGQIRGFAATRGDELLHFGTAAATWGTGLAVLAHDELIREMAAAGVRLARLRVFEENHRAVSFYEKLGWQRTADRTVTTFPPHPALVWYKRDLP